MISLSAEDAIALVRKNLDEIPVNESDMAITSGDINSDDEQIDEIIKKTLPEAINFVHANSPSNLLDGELVDLEAELSSCKISGDVLEFITDFVVLRLIAFQTTDSEQIVMDPVSEYSPEGRMQLNQYSRGTFDRPRLVVLQGKSGNNNTAFKYYSLKKSYSDSEIAELEKGEVSLIKKFECIRNYDILNAVSSYKVASEVVDKVINQLTGMVLAIQNNNNAQYFFNKTGLYTNLNEE